MLVSSFRQQNEYFLSILEGIGSVKYDSKIHWMITCQITSSDSRSNSTMNILTAGASKITPSTWQSVAKEMRPSNQPRVTLYYFLFLPVLGSGYRWKGSQGEFHLDICPSCSPLSDLPSTSAFQREQARVRRFLAISLLSMNFSHLFGYPANINFVLAHKLTVFAYWKPMQNLCLSR